MLVCQLSITRERMVPPAQRPAVGRLRFSQTPRGMLATLGPEARPEDIQQLVGNQPTLVKLLGESFPASLWAQLGRLTTLQRLEIPSAPVTDQDLSTLVDHPALAELVAPATQLSDAGLGRLAQLRELQLLKIGSSRLTPQGLQTLANCQKLRALILVGPNVTDAGLRHLGRLKTLESLYLLGTSVTDQGRARLLEDLPKLHLH